MVLPLIPAGAAAITTVGAVSLRQNIAKLAGEAISGITRAIVGGGATQPTATSASQEGYTEPTPSSSVRVSGGRPSAVVDKISEPGKTPGSPNREDVGARLGNNSNIVSILESIDRNIQIIATQIVNLGRGNSQGTLDRVARRSPDTQAGLVSPAQGLLAAGALGIVGKLLSADRSNPDTPPSTNVYGADVDDLGLREGQPQSQERLQTPPTDRSNPDMPPSTNVYGGDVDALGLRRDPPLEQERIQTPPTPPVSRINPTGGRINRNSSAGTQNSTTSNTSRPSVDNGRVITETTNTPLNSSETAPADLNEVISQYNNIMANTTPSLPVTPSTTNRESLDIGPPRPLSERRLQPRNNTRATPQSAPPVNRESLDIGPPRPLSERRLQSRGSASRIESQVTPQSSSTRIPNVREPAAISNDARIADSQILENTRGMQQSTSRVEVQGVTGNYSGGISSNNLPVVDNNNNNTNNNTNNNSTNNNTNNINNITNNTSNVTNSSRFETVNSPRTRNSLTSVSTQPTRDVVSSIDNAAAGRSAIEVISNQTPQQAPTIINNNNIVQGGGTGVTGMPAAASTPSTPPGLGVMPIIGTYPTPPSSPAFNNYSN